MDNETNIQFKIYRDGHYDKSANLKMKIRNKLPEIVRVIDNFFENH